MELLKQYISALNAAIDAGVDVQAIPMESNRAHPIIRTITINEDRHLLDLWYLDRGQDKRGTAYCDTIFQCSFNDLPNDLREKGWK